MTAEFWYNEMMNVWNILGKDVHIIIIGGEPLEYCELDKLVELLGFNNYSITSNSIALTKERAARLVKFGLPNWTVSIDFPEKVKGLRNKAGFKAIRIFKEFGLPDIHTTITIYPWNVKYLRELLRELKKLDVYIEPTFVCWSKSNHYDSFPSTPIYFTEDKVRMIRNIVFEELSGYDKFHGIYSMFDEDLEVMLKNDWHCKFPSVITVDEDGHTRLCRDIPGKRVRSYTISDLLSGKWSRFVKDWYDEKNRFCMGCNWDCMYMSEANFNRFTHLNQFLR